MIVTFTNDNWTFHHFFTRYVIILACKVKPKCVSKMCLVSQHNANAMFFYYYFMPYTTQSRPHHGQLNSHLGLHIPTVHTHTRQLPYWAIVSGSKSPEQLGVITQVIMTVPGVELMNDPWIGDPLPSSSPPLLLLLLLLLVFFPNVYVLTYLRLMESFDAKD